MIQLRQKTQFHQKNGHSIRNILGKKEDLGFQKTSIVHLESNKDNSGLKIVIDGYPVSLENEKSSNIKILTLQK